MNGVLTDRDKKRYSRQILMENIGEEGQKKLSKAKIGIFGVGGLGSPVATYLAAAGVGRLVLADYQVPDLSNLNRQFLHWEQDVEKGRSKSASAAWKLKEFNRDIDIEFKEVLVTEDNIGEVFEGVTVMADCLDSFQPRLVLNDHCVAKRIPFVHAAVEGFQGQLMAVIPGKTPCLRCLFPTAPPKGPLFPIIGATAGAFGAMEAAEVIKLITGAGRPISSALLFGDLSDGQWERIEISRSEDCKICGQIK